MTKQEMREAIARRAARELKGGEVVGVGVGAPLLLPDFVPLEKGVTFFSDSGMAGFLGAGAGEPAPHTATPEGKEAPLLPGGAVFDSLTAFELLRSGRVDTVFLGALQADGEGSFASSKIPGRTALGPGGAMEMASGARRVILLMEHTKDGVPKIFDKCTYPLTAVRRAKLIITERCVMEVRPEGLLVTELLNGFTEEEVRASTAARLTFLSGE